MLEWDANGKEVMGMGGNGNQDTVSAHSNRHPQTGAAMQTRIDGR